MLLARFVKYEVISTTENLPNVSHLKLSLVSLIRVPLVCQYLCNVSVRHGWVYLKYLTHFGDMPLNLAVRF